MPDAGLAQFGEITPQTPPARLDSDRVAHSRPLEYTDLPTVTGGRFAARREGVDDVMIELLQPGGGRRPPKLGIPAGAPAPFDLRLATA